jgi:transposase
MQEKLRFLGLDVHAETIAAAIAEPDGEVRSLGTIPNRVESIRKLIKKLGPAEKVRACYEAGPTGYVVPDAGSEALRDLVRAREAAKQDQSERGIG